MDSIPSDSRRDDIVWLCLEVKEREISDEPEINRQLVKDYLITFASP